MKQSAEANMKRRLAMLGRKHTPEAKQHMREAQRRPEVLVKTRKGTVGRVLSDESKKKISESNKAFWHSEEGLRKRKIVAKITSEKNKGVVVGWNKGIPWSESDRARISAGMKKFRAEHPNYYRLTDEGRKKLQARKGPLNQNWGRKLSPSHQAALIAANKGRPCSRSTRMKISKALSKAAREGRLDVYRGTKGKYFSIKNSRWMNFHSLLEQCWFAQFDADPEIISYSEQPCAIPYEFEGNPHHYNPDVLVTYKDGSKSIIEIKPESRWNNPQSKAKWSAAKSWCKKLGWSFRIVGIEGSGYDN